ncbi:MAG: hypothetical protein AVDCRST_MAG41-3239, partial [uncultured Corynebacteriales bacterium]
GPATGSAAGPGRRLTGRCRGRHPGARAGGCRQGAVVRTVRVAGAVL